MPGPFPMVIDAMRLNAQSARSLLYLAIFLLAAGGAVGAPVARAFVFGLAASCAAIPALLADGRLRLLSAGVSFLAALFALMTHFRGDPAYDAYLDRARANIPAQAPAAETPPR